MSEMLDLSPAADRMAGVLEGIDDDHLNRSTPCNGMAVRVLIDHVLGLSLAFEAAARKDLGALTDTAPSPTAVELPDDWCAVGRNRLDALRRAWQDPAAWSGRTRAGGLDLPGNIAGLVALDELVVHGWDLAVATGQPYACSPFEIAACTAFAESITEEQRDAGGLFGPTVPVPDRASDLDRLIGLTGRDPAWVPAGG